MSQALRYRLASSLVLAPLVIAAIVLGRPWSLMLLVVLIVILAWEWTSLTLGRIVPLALVALIVGPLCAVLLASYGYWAWAPLALLLAGLCARLPAGPSQVKREEAGWPLIGSFYIGLPCLAFLWLREGHAEGLSWTLWLIAVVWAVDVFAYLVGSRIGGPKLWPCLSPRKTWSGLLGGMTAGILVGTVGGVWIAPPPPWGLAVIAGCLGLIAQGGDLAESAIKRRFGVKDASALIPGHGGLLDRVDGLLPASIALALALWLGA
ncbi:MAG: phosphatidate cytidylyltransferase [Rhodospirillales bacterium]